MRSALEPTAPSSTPRPSSLARRTPPTTTRVVRSSSGPFELDWADTTTRAGHYTVGKELIDTVLDRLRRLADACSGLQGESLLPPRNGARELTNVAQDSSSSTRSVEEPVPVSVLSSSSASARTTARRASSSLVRSVVCSPKGATS